MHQTVEEPRRIELLAEHGTAFDKGLADFCTLGIGKFSGIDSDKSLESVAGSRLAIAGTWAAGDFRGLTVRTASHAIRSEATPGKNLFQPVIR